MLRRTMVIPQQASEAIAALDCAAGLAEALLGLDQAIGQALMIPFAMVVLQELHDGTMQTGFAEEDQRHDQQIPGLENHGWDCSVRQG